jgi:L-threonylcarbamoyladenylate synthase
VIESLRLGPDPGSDGAWKAALERAAAVLHGGGVVSHATDTYYSLSADPLNAAAVRRVFRIKRRPVTAPVPVLVDGVAQAEALLGAPLPRVVRPLVDACWPGPLTLVLSARRELPAGIAGPDGCVGLRRPDWPAAEALIRFLGVPLTGSSANRSGDPGPATAAEVLDGLGSDLDLVLDSGPSPGGPGSTVVRLIETFDGARLQLIREGRVPAEQLAVLSGLETDRSPAGDSGN